jgi:hypothetical protein
MARIVALALLVALGWRFLVRRSRPEEAVDVGWSDGSSAALQPGSPERELLVEIARRALGR